MNSITTLLTTLCFRRGWLALLAALLTLNVAPAAQAGEMKFEAVLVWATDDEASPDDKHKPVDEETKKTLGELPLKWKNFFEVSRVKFTVAKQGSKKVTLSEKCAIEVTHVEGKKCEVKLCGKKGEVCSKQTQAMEKGKSLVLGGNAPNKTAWLVVLKRIE
jgi:hypothetical protein